MSVIIRESVSLDPISSERMDTTGAIHRYNFGWIKLHRVVGGAPGGGEIIESSITGISGVNTMFEETASQELLPPSLETPDVQGAVVVSGVGVTSFYKNGIKKRTMVRSRAIGSSEILLLGQSSFSIVEDKIYADAFGPGLQLTPGSDVQAAEGGVTITAANGIVTQTKIKG